MHSPHLAWRRWADIARLDLGCGEEAIVAAAPGGPWFSAEGWRRRFLLRCLLVTTLQGCSVASAVSAWSSWATVAAQLASKLSESCDAEPGSAV
jgi:hypothetical protein